MLSICVCLSVLTYILKRERAMDRRKKPYLIEAAESREHMLMGFDLDIGFKRNPILIERIKKTRVIATF